MSDDAKDEGKLFLGVDVGGTKMLAALVRPSGRVLARERRPTPREGTPVDTINAIAGLIDDLLTEAGQPAEALRAIGLAIPGVVDPEAGRIVITPNMNLTGTQIVEPLRERFGVEIALGNDANCGALGEKWLGSASYADSAVGIFVGTGIGGGLILQGREVRGYRGVAGEIGHMKVQLDGPVCGCGDTGCLEALASRTAIDRDIRQAVQAGQKTLLTDLVGPDLSVIKSGALRKALEQNDKLVTQVMRNASEILAQACLSIRHVLDPEVIVLGGGLVEACDFFILPIVEKILECDPMQGSRPGGRVVVSSLGDDAVMLGAVVLAQQAVGRRPLKKTARQAGEYPAVGPVDFGEVRVGDKLYLRDIYIRVNGKVKKRDKALAKINATAHSVTVGELEKVCKGGPALLIVGTGHDGRAEMTEAGATFLRRRGIECKLLPTPEAVTAYNAAQGRKALILHVTC